MRNLRGVGMAVFTVALAFLVSACSPHEPAATPKPSTSSKPVFASDADALAAATKAYAAYLGVEDQVASEAGRDPDRISEFVTTEQLTRERESFKELSSEDKYSRGKSAFDTVSLQQYSDNHDGTATLSTYLCLDVSAVRIFNASAVDVTPADRTDRYPLVIEFDVKDSRSTPVLISNSDSWKGSNFCGS